MPNPPKSRPKRTPASTTTTTTTTPSTNPSTNPFTPPSPALLTLLSPLPTTHPQKLYILHLDPTTPPQRLLLFTTALLLNTLLALLLLYRFSTALPTYLSLFAATLGHTSGADSGYGSAGEGAVLVLKRMGIFFLDFWVLGRVVGEIPLGFFWGVGGRGGCVGWRLRVGWPRPRNREVVVRRSRAWFPSPLPEGDPGEEDNKDGLLLWAGGIGMEVVVEKVKTAVRREVVGRKGALVLIDRDWELDFRGMEGVQGVLGMEGGWGVLEEGGPVVAVFIGGEEGGWVVWRPWEVDKGGEEEREGEGGRKLRLFKDGLTGMGKEGLFFRWVELMQYEASLGGGGGFTSEGRDKAVEKSRELFFEHGVSWDDVVRGIGGVEGLPGMEITG
ncbi:MAG: hypothetical protein Q9219_001897 [cf. Caloplaca sp. 3 TL-2023]